MARPPRSRGWKAAPTKPLLQSRSQTRCRSCGGAISRSAGYFSTATLLPPALSSPYNDPLDHPVNQMNTQTTWFRTIAALLSLSMVLIGCATAPLSIEPTAAAITKNVVAGDHVKVQTPNEALEFWVTAVNDTHLQGTAGPNNQGRSVDVAIADIYSISVYRDDSSGGGTNTLTIILVVIGVIAAIALLANDSAEDRFQNFPNP